jgi:hypothetical protein
VGLPRVAVDALASGLRQLPVGLSLPFAPMRAQDHHREHDVGEHECGRN